MAKGGDWTLIFLSCSELFCNVTTASLLQLQGHRLLFMVTVKILTAHMLYVNISINLTIVLHFNCTSKKQKMLLSSVKAILN